MREKEFHYNWWGKGDIDASLGIFFDGFSKVLTAVGIMTAVFGMPIADVIGKVVPGIGISIFVGNMWYFFEACQLAKKEKRQNVTAQPFGIGASQLSGWLYLIIGPVYWQTKDSTLALQVGIAASFLGGFIEILGGIAGRWIITYVPNAALMGNMASAGLVWLSVVGIAKEVPVMISTSAAGIPVIKEKMEEEYFIVGPVKDKSEVTDEMIAEMKANSDKILVIATGDKAPDSHVALYIMKKFGLDKVLVETPSYMHYLVSQKLMDELFFNYSCIYVGGQALTIGKFGKEFTSTDHPHTRMLSIHTHSDHFFYFRPQLIYD